jgi:subfamily B ATP-binding cassette protein MsbA
MNASRTQELTDWRVYRRLLGYSAKFKWAFFLSIVGFSLYASTAPMLAHLMEIIEEAVRDPSDALRWLLCASIIGIFIFRGIGTFLGTYFIAKVSRGIVHLLRCELFAKLLHSPTHFFDTESTGSLITRITYDVEQVASAASMAVTTFVREGLTVASLLGYMLYLNWQLTLVFLTAAPLIGIIVAKATKYFKKYSQRVKDSVSQVTQVTQEAVTGYKEVKNFGGYDYENSRFFAASERNFTQHLKYVRTSAISIPFIQLLVAFAIAALVWVALSPDFLQTMTSGQFFAFFTAATTMAKPLRVLASLNSTVQRGIVGAHSAFTVLDMSSEPDEGTKTLERVTGSVRFQNIHFQYPNAETPVLCGIDLEVSPGQSIALVGRSGSGKTTLISLLTRFYEVQSGQIHLDGVDITELDLTFYRRQMALVSQQVTLFNGTVAENIAYGELQNASMDSIERAAKLAYAHDFIQQLPQGYNTQIGDDGTLLSGGQRQRLAIARALLKDAPILIMDEATSALDNESEQYVQKAIEQAMKGRTTFVIAHRLSTIEQADTIVVMNQGRIVEMGRHQELLARGQQYASLHASHFESS